MERIIRLEKYCIFTEGLVRSNYLMKVFVIGIALFFQSHHLNNHIMNCNFYETKEQSLLRDRFLIDGELVWVTEEFRDIPDYEGYYQASTFGRIKSLERTIAKKSGILYHVNGCILKKMTNNLVYFVVNLFVDTEPYQFTVHQLIAITFLGYKRNGKYDVVVDHINNIPKDNRLYNLQLISARENSTKDNFSRGFTSKYVGVHWDKERYKWRSAIIINNKRKHLGRFDNEIDASNAYQDALKEIIDD